MAKLNESNHIVTLGYLASLINGLNLKDYEGKTITLDYDGKEIGYCPICNDLGNGRFLANAVIGETPEYDDDGLDVESENYETNQLVKKLNTSVQYTRLNTFTINASKNTANACGDSIILTSNITFKRYIKSVNGEGETVTTSEDVVLHDGDIKITYTTSIGSIEENILTIPKNGTVSSDTRSITVSANIMFRNEEIVSDNQITITQSPLTGTWEKISSGITYDNFSITPMSFDCDGGTLIKTGTYTTWDNYKYKDSCNVYYDDMTEIRNLVTGQTETSTEVISAVDCSSISGTYDKTTEVTWHGKTASYRQTCVCCGCDDIQFTASTSSIGSNAVTSFTVGSYTVESPCTISNPTVSAYTTSDGNVQATWITNINDTNGTITCDISENTGLSERETWFAVHGVINGSECEKRVKIVQVGYDCTCGNLTVEEKGIQGNCSGETSFEVGSYSIFGECNLINPTITKNANWISNLSSIIGKSGTITCDISPYTGITDRSAEIIIRGTINGNSCEKSLLVYQRGYNCSCTDFSVNGTSVHVSNTGASEFTVGSYSLFGECTLSDKSYSAYTDETGYTQAVWISNITDTNGIIKCDVSATTNASLSERQAWIAIRGKINDNWCEKRITITQDAYSCSCDDFSVEGYSVLADKDGETINVGEYGALGQCSLTNPTFKAYTTSAGTTTADWISNVNGNNGIVSCTIAQNTSLTARTAWIEVKGTINGNQCSERFTVMQEAANCSCDNFALSSTASTVSANQGTYLLNTVSVSGSCITIGQMHSNQLWLTNIGISNHVITGDVSSNTGDARTAIVTVPYSSFGTSCGSKTFEVTQAAYSCECKDVTLHVTTSAINFSGITENTVIASVYYNDYCTPNNLLAKAYAPQSTTSSDWLTASIAPNNHDIVVTARYNSSTSSRQAYIKVTYDYGGNSCSSSFTVTQSANTCSCSNLEVSSTSQTGKCSGETAFTAGTYEWVGGCQGDAPNFGTGVDWISNIKASGGVVTCDMQRNTSTSTRTATLVAHVMINGVQCEKEIYVVQERTDCDCSSFALSSSTTPVSSNFGNYELNKITTSGYCITIGTITSNQTWIHDLGISNDTITGIVESNTDDGRTATITVPYSSFGASCGSKTFEVTQSSYSCNCNDVNVNVSATSFGFTSVTSLVIGSISYGTYCIPSNVNAVAYNPQSTTPCSWLTASTSNDQIIIDADYNSSTSSRQAYIKVTYNVGGSSCSSSFTVTQSANTCSCSNLEVSSTSQTGKCSGETAFTAGTYEWVGGCQGDAPNFGTGVDWISSITASNGVVTCSMGRNTSTSTRTATLVAHVMINGVQCEKEIYVTQEATDCSCDNFALTLTANTLSASHGSYTLNTVSTSGSCITIGTITSNQTWLTSLYELNGTIWGSVSDNTSSSREATVTVNYSAFGASCGSKTFKVTQSSYSCRCSDVTVTTSVTSFDFTSISNQTIATVSWGSYCVPSSINATVYEHGTSTLCGWLEATTASQGHEIIVSGAYNSGASRQADIVVTYNVGGNSCSSSFTVTQSANTCGCSDFTVTSSETTCHSSGATAYIAGTYQWERECQGTDPGFVPSVNWITNVHSSRGVVTCDIAANTNITARSAILTAYVTINGVQCTKTIEVNQDAYECGCTDLGLVIG